MVSSLLSTSFYSLHLLSAKDGLQVTIYLCLLATHLFLAEDGLQLLNVLRLECEELLGFSVEYELHLVGKLVCKSVRWVHRE